MTRQPTKRARAAREERNMSTSPVAEYITERELSSWIGMSRPTLQQMRWRGEGPPYVKIGTKAVRYHVPSVREWLQARMVAPAR